MHRDEQVFNYRVRNAIKIISMQIGCRRTEATDMQIEACLLVESPLVFGLKLINCKKNDFYLRNLPDLDEIYFRLKSYQFFCRHSN